MNDAISFWNQQAKSFDLEPDHGLQDPTVRTAWTQLLGRLLPAAQSRIVDLGCGTGTLSVLMAQLGHEVTGIDFSADMVMAARRKADAAAVDVTFLTRDVSDPGIDGPGFDVALTRHVLWALSDPAGALGRWIEMLGPDGRLVLIEGRWFTGAGLDAAETIDLLGALGRAATVFPPPSLLRCQRGL